MILFGQMFFPKPLSLAFQRQQTGHGSQQMTFQLLQQSAEIYF
jgi:hypothetical protein